VSDYNRAQRRKFNKNLKAGIKKLTPEQRYKLRMAKLSDYLLFTVAQLEVEEGKADDFMDIIMEDLRKYIANMAEGKKPPA